MSVYVPEQANGHAPADTGRIPFDDGPTDDLHPDVASKVLRICRKKYPQVFMTCLAAAYGVDLAAPTRARKPKAGEQ